MRSDQIAQSESDTAMRRRRRWYLVAGVAIAVLGTGILVWSGASPDHMARRTAPLATAPPAPQQVPRVRLIEWREGLEYPFDFTENVTVTTGGAPIVTFRLEGVLTVTALPSDPGVSSGLAMVFQGDLVGLSPQRVNTNGADPDAPRLAMNTEFSQPFLIDYGENGLHATVHTAPGVSDFVAQVWRALASTLDFRFEGPGETWRTRESGALGNCQVDYGMERRGRFIKSRTGCDGSVGGAAPVAYESVASVVTFEMGPASTLSSVTSIERVVTESSGPVPAFASSSELALVARPPQSRELLSAESLAGMLDMRNTPSIPSSASAELDDARIAGRTMPGLLAQLTDLQALASNRELTDAEEQRLGRAHIGLRALLTRDVEAVEAAVEHLEDGGPVTDILIAALGEAGTPQTQAALRDALDEGALTELQRLAVTRSLSRVAHPTESTLNSLAELRDDRKLGKQASYGMGSNIFRLQQDDPELAERALEELLRDLAEATTDGARIRALISLGNAGHPGALESIAAYRNAASPSVRAAVAKALRRIPGDRADELLVGVLMDSSPTVRESAVGAISGRTASPALVDAIASVVTSDPEFRPRARAAQTAAGWLRERAVLAAPLRSAARSDPNESIRTIAANALTRNGYST